MGNILFFAKSQFRFRQDLRNSACLLLLSLLAWPSFSQVRTANFPEQTSRWQIEPDGSIYWAVGSSLPHNDHIEMSGEKCSLWVQYEVDSSRKLHLKRTVVFPTYRMKPNNTHSSMMQVISDEDLPRFFINNKPLRTDLINGNIVNGLPEKVTGIRHHGIMEVYSSLEIPGGSKTVGNTFAGKSQDGAVLRVKRSLFPSTSLPMAIEKFIFTNISDQPVTIDMDYQFRETRMDTSRTYGSPHSLILMSLGDGSKILQPGDSASFAISYQAAANSASAVVADAAREEEGRRQRVISFSKALELNTPDTILNTAFAFAKIRAAESIFKTKAGYMHSPGGLAYYAAIWANDQAEYISPFFAWLGDPVANQSAMNAYRLFATYMNNDFHPIPSSIIAEGDGYWNGAGDRGDQAMIAYGASRYALAYGNADSARKLWPLIVWCLEYCKRQLNADGVVASHSDELEGRFPSGDANLCTSSLYYDALISAAGLSRLIGQPVQQTEAYIQQAKDLRVSIEMFFGAWVQGFNTYRYYKGNEVLRSWICMPLTVGIFDRKTETIKAIFSPALFTPDGLLTQAGDKTFWDRSTLYALRGILAAGETEMALSYLRYYSTRRLLGEHVPYPVEAYPEGNQRHLSAESGLYCRIYTEGLFGMRPTGFRTFDCTPRLPKDWNTMQLKHIKAFENDFDITVDRWKEDKIKVRISRSGNMADRKAIIREYTMRNGETAHVVLPQ